MSFLFFRKAPFLTAFWLKVFLSCQPLRSCQPLSLQIQWMNFGPLINIVGSNDKLSIFLYFQTSNICFG